MRILPKRETDILCFLLIFAISHCVTNMLVFGKIIQFVDDA